MSFCHYKTWYMTGINIVRVRFEIIFKGFIKGETKKNGDRRSAIGPTAFDCYFRDHLGVQLLRTEEKRV